MAHLVSSELSFIGGVYIGARALLEINLIYCILAISLAYPSGEEWGLLHVQMIYLPSRLEEGGRGVSTLCEKPGL
jgi:hypothetical protein